MEDASRIPLPPGDDDFEGPPAQAAGRAAFRPPNGLQQQQFFPPQQPFQPWFNPQPWVAAQQQPVHLPAKVKLPAFWPRDAAAWFELAESTFNRLNAHGSLLRYEYVLMALPEDVLEKVRSVMQVARTVADPYGLLRGRLVELFTPSVMQRLNGIIWQPELGGRRPSELMEAMLALLPPGEQPGLLFKAMFIHRLPNDMRDRVALDVQRAEPRELAALADQLYFVRNAGQPVASGVQEELVAAMAKTQVGTGRGKQGRKTKKADDDGRKLCWAHRNFGVDAYRCKDKATCEWKEKPGNE